MAGRKERITETVEVGAIHVGDDGSIAFRLDRRQWRGDRQIGGRTSSRGVVRPGANLAGYHPDIAAMARSEWKKRGLEKQKQTTPQSVAAIVEERKGIPDYHPVRMASDLIEARADIAALRETRKGV